MKSPIRSALREVYLGSAVLFSLSFSLGSCSLWSPSDDSLASRCPEGTKTCNGLCVSRLDPEVGCAADACDPCPSLAHAASVCSSAGICKMGSCQEGHLDCDEDPTNGCEEDSRISVDHCGTCGVACSVENGAASCENGNCQVATCLSGWGDCDGDQPNGCETATSTSNEHCGTCGNRCEAGTSCKSGSCVFGDVAVWLGTHPGGWCNAYYNNFINLCGDVAFCFDSTIMRTYPDGLAVDIGLHYDGASLGLLLDVGGDSGGKRMSCSFLTPGVVRCAGPGPNTVEAPLQAGTHLVSYRVSQSGAALFIDGQLADNGTGSVDVPELLGAAGPGFVLGQRIAFWWEAAQSVAWLRAAPFFLHLRDQSGSFDTFSLAEVATPGVHTVAMFENGPTDGSTSWPRVAGPIDGVLCGGTNDPETGTLGPAMPCAKDPGWVNDVALLCPQIFAP